ncbi:hypothetical protein [Listeria phage List-36]|uniref:Uncharacterized protein n=2 Tax=Pecentumvirus list36 TaxID=2560560 RepID=A0A060ALC3_9CAUD|nr:hypothetical protein HH35_gp099 [Listeria phage List-36]AIA64268.1 hypothetical protein [Listeria phage List-36]QIG60825.1 hypothetical protein vBLinoVEfB7_082 [Listeria phage vB_Lino_VEfB7]QIG61013.1 hypothetical protein vBLivaVAfA18_089 [Listeria phage vB_Liva_VAfA18]
MTIENTKTLEQTLNTVAEEKDYDLFLSTLAGVVKSLYKEYQFLRQDPAPEDKTSGNILIFQIFRGDPDGYAKDFDTLFKIAVDRNLEHRKISQKFFEWVEKGKFLELGDNIVISRDGTGVSSIVESVELKVFITFMTKSYAEEREEFLAKEKEKQEEAKKKEEERLALKEESYKALGEATEMLNTLMEEQGVSPEEIALALEQGKESYRNAR